MEGATEYRDTWRGLRILAPRGWRVRRSGAGIFLYSEEAAQQAIIVQPRARISTVGGLAHMLQAWLKRFDAQAEVRVAAEQPPGVYRAQARLYAATGEEIVSSFALQVGEGGGLITGFAAPAVSHDSAKRLAGEVLASLAPAPRQGRHPWREPAEGACAALVPEGWQAEGRLSRANPAALPSVTLHAWADEHTSVTAAAEGRLFVEPGLLSGILGGLAGGMVGRSRFVDAAGYAEAHALPQLRKEAADAQIDAIIPRPDLVPMMVAQEAATTAAGAKDIMQGQPSAADVVFSFHVGEQAVRQVSRVVTMRVPPALAHGMPLWMATTPYTYRAPAGELAQCEPVLEGVGQSFEVDAGWRQRQQAQMAARIGQRLPETHRADSTALLAEAESLLCAWGRHPLALHERPFVAEREAEQECEAGAAGLAPLYDRAAQFYREASL